MWHFYADVPEGDIDSFIEYWNRSFFTGGATTRTLTYFCGYWVREYVDKYATMLLLDEDGYVTIVNPESVYYNFKLVKPTSKPLRRSNYDNSRSAWKRYWKTYEKRPLHRAHLVDAAREKEALRFCGEEYRTSVFRKSRRAHHHAERLSGEHSRTRNTRKSWKRTNKCQKQWAKSSENQREVNFYA